MRHAINAFFFALSVLFLSSVSVQAQHAKQRVDRVLVLAMDVSRSVNDARYALQIKGYAAAFRDAETIRTITTGPRGSVAVTLAQWGDWGEYTQTVSWTVIRTAADGRRFADQIEKTVRVPMGGTSIAWAILMSTKLIDQAPYMASRSIIDISGDGPDNTMPAVSMSMLSGRGQADYEVSVKRMLARSGTDRLISLPEARNTACGAGIDINGLAIEGADDVEDLASYYRKHVICKKGSFVIRVENPDSYDEFSRAIIRKIRHELGT